MVTYAKGHSLVTIVIPCFNAAKWLNEAIDSCFFQTYPSIEIIVIDDGSTDGSIDILSKYQNKIVWETGTNRGGNYARNRGIELANGEYIHFLDADDYILPQKIEKQVAFLEETSADVVYGDWRYQLHRDATTTELLDVVTANSQQDIVESLLKNWWVPCHALLFRRQAVLDSGGWDTSLKAAQDRDFFIQVALSGADIRYQPGCYTVYRRYGNVTVSTTNQHQRYKDMHKVLKKAEHKLTELENLIGVYRNALAQSYFFTARCYYSLPDVNRDLYLVALQDAKKMNASFKPAGVSKLYSMTYRFLGFQAAENQDLFLQKIVRRVQGITRTLFYKTIGPSQTRFIARIFMRLRSVHSNY